MTPAAVPQPTNRDAAMQMFQLLQQQAQMRGTTLRPPPPEPSSCCGRGCNGCVWEAYLAAAGFWREDALLALQAREPIDPEQAPSLHTLNDSPCCVP